MKHIAYIAAALILSISCVYGQKDTLSLDQLLAIADGRSVEIQAAYVQLEQRKLDYDLHRARQRFQLNLNANVPNFLNTSRSVVQPDGSVIFKNISQNTTQAGLQLSKSFLTTNTQLLVESNALRFDDFSFDRHSYNGIPVRVGIRQGINSYNNDKWNERILPQAMKTEAARSQDQIAEQHLIIVQSYFDVLRAQVEQDIASSNSANNSKIVDIANERYALGKISESDLTLIKLNAATSKNDLSRAKRSYTSTVNILQENTNYYEDIAPTIPQKLPKWDVKNYDNLVNEAWKKNKAYHQLMLDQLLLDSDSDRIKKQYGFRGELLASLGLVKSGNQLGEIYQDPKQEVLVNMTLTLPILDGNQKKVALQKQLIAQELQQDRKVFAEQAFKNQLKTLLQQMENRAEEVEQSKEIFDLAKKGYQIANDRYRLADMTVTELTLAYQVRDQAWRTYIRTISDYWVSYYRLEMLMGYDFSRNTFLNRDK